MITPVQLFKCLSDSTRLQCITLIANYGELCVCELMAVIDESQPKISRHLALLRKHQILADSKQGQWVFYRLHDALPPWANTIIQTSLNAQQPFLQHAQIALNAIGDRPVRQQLCCS